MTPAVPRILRPFTYITSSLLALSLSTAVSAQGMTELLPLSGYTESRAFGISADGSVIVGGNSGMAPAPAVYWDGSGNVTSLGVLPGGGSFAAARGVSGDGTVIVGFGTITNTITGYTEYQAFRRDGVNGYSLLGVEGTQSYAYGANTDGSVIVGSYEDANPSVAYRAFRWDAVSGMQDIGSLIGFGPFDSYYRVEASDVNADGSVIVGYSNSGNGTRAFRWVQTYTALGAAGGPLSIVAAGGGIGGVMQDLGSFGGESRARAVNADGTVVVGYSYATTGGAHAFRWVEGGGPMQDLGTLSGGTYAYSIANDVNADGTVVVGRSSGPTGGDMAFRWTDDGQGGGTMENLGVLNPLDSYSSARGVSADGTIVVGESGDGEGAARAFIYRDAMLDLVNTQTAIGQSAADQGGAVDMSNASLGAMLGRELEVSRSGSGGAAFSSKGAGGHARPVAIRFEGTLASNVAIGTQASGGATAAVGIGERLTFGGFVTTGNEISALGGFGVDTQQTAGGIYLRSRAADRTGLTWKAALAYSGGDARIVRAATLANTEAGTGTSLLATTAGSFEIGTGIQAGKALLTPFVRIAAMSTTRAGYTEANTIAFPVTYDAYRQDIVVATVGIEGRTQLSPTHTLRYGIGLEQDLSRSANPVTGTSAVPGMTTFSVPAPAVVNASRGYATIGISHRFTNGSEVTLDAGVRQSPYATAPTLSAAVGYEIRF